jgi:uncharacterized cupin superfamily protein
MPKLELDAIPQVNRTGYPPPFDREMAGRFVRRLATATGMAELGAAHVVLKPGGWSSQRHWHVSEDEFLVMLTGEGVLVEDEGPSVLRPGDMVAWPKGVPNGHHIRNESSEDCSFVVFSAGSREGGGEYSDIDMKFTSDGYVHKDGTPYPAERIS